MDDKNAKKLFYKFKSFLKKKDLKLGFECDDGWYQTLVNMFTEIADSNPPVGFKVTRVFDKFDELHVYTTGGVNATRFIIEKACEQAAITCSKCGNEKALQQCDKCKESVDAAIANYVPDIKEAIAPVNVTQTVPTTSTPITLTGNPSDYYFKLENDPFSVPPDFFLVTPKAHWDVNKTLYSGDQQAIRTLLANNGFHEMEESMFEYQTATGAPGVPSAGHALLLSLGFVENTGM